MFLMVHKQHADKLKVGLILLGPEFVARLCYWCEVTTLHYPDGYCDVCGRNKPYGTALGLLVGDKPASDSVVNQVLVAAERHSFYAKG